MRMRKLLRPGIWSYALNRMCTWYPLRRRLASWVAGGRPAHHRAEQGEADRLEAELQRDGIAMLPAFVDAAAMGRIRAHLEGAQLAERFAPFRRGFTVDDVPDNVHVAEYSTAHILRCPDVVNLANDPRLIEVAGRYLGCRPTISNLSIWWSLPADGTAQEAENYHRDVDDWRFVKFFLYLSDVDETAGPHCFVRGSHRSPKFLRIRRVTDEEVSGAFPREDQLRIAGRAGDAFLEDTFGLHKGQPPTRIRRLLFQVEYSVNPIAVYDYDPAPVGYANLDMYTNRLYLKAGA